MNSQTRLSLVPIVLFAIIAGTSCSSSDSDRAPERPSGAQSTSASEGDQAPLASNAIVAKAVRYLMERQAPDGGWHSDTYGALRGGAATTALVLYAISHVPATQRAPYYAQLKRGWRFLSSGLEQSGFVVNPDGSADYPTYATAMALTASRQLGWTIASQQRQQMVDYLVGAQLTERQGWTVEDVHYGGWDMAGGSTAAGERITPGTNLSVTCFALEALALDSGADAVAARRKALTFLGRCQNVPGDGGFVFSPIPNEPGNKAGYTEDEAGRSYGTMTSDGLRALLLCGESSGSSKVVAASHWLQSQKDLTKVPGFDGAPASAAPWENDLRFYYWSSLAKATRQHLSLGMQYEQTVFPLLGKLQSADGSWTNDTPTARMREDDPLIATALAIIALSK